MLEDAKGLPAFLISWESSRDLDAVKRLQCASQFQSQSRRRQTSDWGEYKADWQGWEALTVPSSYDQSFLPRSYHLSMGLPGWSENGRTSIAVRAMNVLAPKLSFTPLIRLMVENTSCRPHTHHRLSFQQEWLPGAFDGRMGLS